MNVADPLYRVMRNQEYVYAGDDALDACIMFIATISKVVIDTGIKGQVAVMRGMRFTPPACPVIEGRVNGKLAAVMYGVTWEIWIEHMPTGGRSVH